jgi:hypothetical protein
MEVLLGKVTQQAMNYAIRSGIALSASYAIKQTSKLLRNVPNGIAKDEVYGLQQRLQSRVNIITPAIDMIELIAARGNTSLDSATSLVKELRHEIQTLSKKIAAAARSNAGTPRTPAEKARQEIELKAIAADIKAFLVRVEDALPLLNLAITTSGVTLSNKLPHTVSPSRLLQASTFLTAGDTQYCMPPHTAVQIGPTFTLSIYMLFAGHNRPQTEEEIRETTWKEVIHKARVKIRRVPLHALEGSGSRSQIQPTSSISSASNAASNAFDIPAESRFDEYAYQLLVVEDLDDDRVHDFEEGQQQQPSSFDDIPLAGVRETIPIHQISKIFYADTSKVLNIGTDSEGNHPVLLLKRDVNAFLPRRMMEREDEPAEKEAYASDGEEDEAASQLHQQQNSTINDSQPDDPWRLPPSLDPEWVAFEVYEMSAADDVSISSNDEITESSFAGLQPTPSLDQEIAKLNPNSPPPLYNGNEPSMLQSQSTSTPSTSSPPWTSQIKTSLSLLELLLRLTSLQQFQQQSHLSITDELLNFFLEESATTGAGGDERYRQAVRADARRRVGWDPYDESPIKRRGEDYQYGSPGYYSPGGGGTPSGSVVQSPVPNGQDGEVSFARSPLSRGESYNEGWSPRPSLSPRVSGGSVGSPSPLIAKGREQWLRNDRAGVGRGRGVGSPLRPGTGRSDEGLGTSPASGMKSP